MPVKVKGDKVTIEQATEFTAEVKRKPRKKDHRKSGKKGRK